MTQSNITRGVLVADRFEVETLAGFGGMGLVFRAPDGRRGYDAADDRAAAQVVLLAAQRQILRRAGQIPEAAMRERFLGQATHARVQELLRAWSL